jgi:hypothetical protein
VTRLTSWPHAGRTGGTSGTPAHRRLGTPAIPERVPLRLPGGRRAPPSPAGRPGRGTQAPRTPIPLRRKDAERADRGLCRDWWRAAREAARSPGRRAAHVNSLRPVLRRKCPSSTRAAKAGSAMNDGTDRDMTRLPAAALGALSRSGPQEWPGPRKAGFRGPGTGGPWQALRHSHRRRTHSPASSNCRPARSGKKGPGYGKAAVYGARPDGGLRRSSLPDREGYGIPAARVTSGRGPRADARELSGPPAWWCGSRQWRLMPAAWSGRA